MKKIKKLASDLVDKWGVRIGAFVSLILGAIFYYKTKKAESLSRKVSILESDIEINKMEKKIDESTIDDNIKRFTDSYNKSLSDDNGNND